MPNDLSEGMTIVLDRGPPRLSISLNCPSNSSYRPGKTRNWAIMGFPVALTIAFPLKSSQTSPDVEDISSISARALFSLALPIKDLAIRGPDTRIAPVIMVRMPSGTIANTR